MCTHMFALGIDRGSVFFFALVLLSEAHLSFATGNYFVRLCSWDDQSCALLFHSTVFSAIYFSERRPSVHGQKPLACALCRVEIAVCGGTLFTPFYPSNRSRNLHPYACMYACSLAHIFLLTTNMRLFLMSLSFTLTTRYTNFCAHLTRCDRCLN